MADADASRSRLGRRLLYLAALAAVSFVTRAAAVEPAATPAPPPSALALTKVTVTPTGAGTDTLCQLRVEIANRGDRVASELAFTVKVNGHELPVYGNQLFMQRLDPGKTATVRLYNFWTTESGRPAPADGKYRVEVTLAAARWYQIATDNGAEVWTPVGAVPGLPVIATAIAGR